MTNEEIQRRYDELERTLPTGQSMSLEDHREVERLVLNFARELVSQAYEDAAELAERRCGYWREEMSETARANEGQMHDKQAWVYNEARYLAEHIRALKDSLAPEPVAS